jgi:hypothetical protein
MPYTPEESLKALKYFYRERGKDVFGPYGPYDAFNDELNWVKKAYIGIDQGPIVVMIENHRTGLLWNSVMVDADVRAGLTKLGFQTTSVSPVPFRPDDIKIYPNPGANLVYINPAGFVQPVTVKIFTTDGRLMMIKEIGYTDSIISLDCSALSNGFYIIQLTDRKKSGQARLIIQK